MFLVFFFQLIITSNSFIFSNKNTNSHYEQLYVEFLQKHNKLPSDNNNILPKSFTFFSNTQFDENKFNTFKKNLDFIESKNEYLSSNENTFQLGTNELFDEISYTKVSSNVMKQPFIPRNLTFSQKYSKFLYNPFQFLRKIIDFDNEFSWNNTGFLSNVKNQGRCGSCWAFSTTSSLETFMRSKGYNVTRLSEQELVDCSSQNHGCNGGFMHFAFDYIIDQNGLTEEFYYPYNAKDNNCTISCENASSCSSYHFNSLQNKTLGSKLSKYEFTIPNSIMDRMISLQTSPICIALDASSIFFQYYKSGIIDIQLNNSHLNHAVLLIGYGFDEVGMYWIIQNSWGTSWGENGYCKIRVQDGEGILLTNIYGVYPTRLG